MAKAQMKKDEHVKLLLDLRAAVERLQKNVGRIKKIVNKSVPAKEFATVGSPQLRRMERLTDQLLTEADQLHELWLKEKTPRT